MISFAFQIFPVDASENMSDVLVTVCLKVKIGIRLLPAQGTAKEVGEQIAHGDMIPEDLVKGTGAYIVIDQHLIIPVAWIGVSHMRCHNQYCTRPDSDNLIGKMNRTLTGEGIIHFKVFVLMPVCRHVAQHLPGGNILLRAAE